MDTKAGRIRTWRPAQALMELAVGMFAFALVVTALAGFAIYIAKSLKMQNSIRTGASTQTDSVEFSTFGAKYVFGAEKLNIRESVTMPSRAIVVGE